MEKYIAGYSTNIGSKKNVNQDSLCIRKADLNGREVLMVVVCDGMGGLSRGEAASAAVVQAFAESFLRDLPKPLLSGAWGEIEVRWRKLITEMNEKLWRYGEMQGTQLGTTLTVLLLFCQRYLVAQVGDSRVYAHGKELIQITEDQSLVAREVKRGNITCEEAARDPRRNILLECIGVSSTVNPEFFFGKVEKGESFLVCSDGFWHDITHEEMMREFQREFKDEKEISERLNQIILQNIERGEQDNITAVYIQQIEKG